MVWESNGVYPHASFWLDVADKTIKALAVLVAAVWTYYNQVKSRTYKPRAGCSVTGEIFTKNGRCYVLCACKLRNDGRSKLTINQEGTCLQAVAVSEDGREQLPVAEVFKEHRWIEPEEVINEPILLRIPDPLTFVALKLNLRVVSEGTEWNASCILKEAPQETGGNFSEIS